MVLSNITVNPSAIQTLLSLKIRLDGDHPVASRAATSPTPTSSSSAPSRDAVAIALLMDAFVDAAVIPGEPKQERKRKGDLHFLASVFANITVVRSLVAFIICDLVILHRHQ